MLRPEVPTPPERWEAVMTLLDAALERPAASRAAFVAAAAGADAALRDEVVSLLAMEQEADGFLDAPAVLPGGVDAGLAGHLRAAVGGAGDGGGDGGIAGRRVGPYRLECEVGRGGMGTVYLAEREDVGKRVALKLVRGDLAAPERVARFLVERRVLARLDHPNIARLLDAGVTDDGTPWLAMEHVEGAPLDRHCDERCLTVPERLRLVEQVCDAVAFAHRSLVVHRDLKPNNVLVTPDGVVKLLDFGIAKLLDEDAAGTAAVRTGTGMQFLTPDYAAPEQARGEPVTTATDVYALGVMLHELLAGARPQRATSGPVGALTPPRPAARPSSVLSAATAATRGVTPERLRRQLVGDLDTIVLKALESDPERRYPSAAALLDDLRRHRTGFPVRARPASRAYRAGAFVRRNRWGVAGAAGLFALLVGIAIVTTVQEQRTRRALARATAEAAKARQVTRFVTSLLQAADPYRTGATSLAELLTVGGDRLDRELAAQPEVRVELLRTLAEVQRNLGRRAQADTLLRRAIAERRRLAAGDGRDAELARLLTDLARVRRMRSDAGGADTLLTQALATYAALGDAPADEAVALYELGVTRRLLSRGDDAEALLRRALALQRRLPDAVPAAAATLAELAQRRMDVGDLPGSELLRREAIAILERALGPGHPRLARFHEFLAGFFMDAGRLEEAERTARRALDIERRHLQPGHPDILTTQSTLSQILVRRGDVGGAERLQREVLDGRRRLLGDTSRDVAGSLYVLARTRRLRGDLAEATALMTRSLATYDRVSGARDPDSRQVLAELAVMAHGRGQDDEALRLAARLRGMREAPTWDADAQDLATLAEMVRDDGGGDCRGAASLFGRAVARHAARHVGAGEDAAHLAAWRAEAARCAAPPSPAAARPLPF